MSELNPMNDEERALLDRYANLTSPSPAQVEQALTRTFARLESSKRPARLPDPRRRFVWIAAAGLATLVVATAAFAGVRWLRARTHPAEPTYGAKWSEPVESGGEANVNESVPAQEPIDPELAPELAPEPPTTPSTSEPAESDMSIDVSAPRRRNPSTETKPAGPADTDTDAAPVAEPIAEPIALAEESRLLAHARRALHDDDFESALDWVDEHARRHPAGVLSEERLVLEAVAACRNGQRARGLAAAKQLREQFPNTPTLAKVEQSCGGE